MKQEKSKLKENREKEIKKRKNFFPTLLLIIALWLTLAGLIYFTDPQTFGLIPLFFLLLFAVLFFTFSTILINTRRGIILASGLTIFVFLAYLGIGNVLNLILIIAILITIEFYFSKKSV